MLSNRLVFRRRCYNLFSVQLGRGKQILAGFLRFRPIRFIPSLDATNHSHNDDHSSDSDGDHTTSTTQILTEFAQDISCRLCPNPPNIL